MKQFLKSLNLVDAIIEGFGGVNVDGFATIFVLGVVEAYADDRENLCHRSRIRIQNSQDQCECQWIFHELERPYDHL